MPLTLRFEMFNVVNFVSLVEVLKIVFVVLIDIFLMFAVASLFHFIQNCCKRPQLFKFKFDEIPNFLSNQANRFGKKL